MLGSQATSTFRPLTRISRVDEAARDEPEQKRGPDAEGGEQIDHIRAWAFDRAVRAARSGTKAHKAAIQGVGEVEDARALLTLLSRAVETFIKWKVEAEREREERDCHSLMREYVLDGDPAGLIRARTCMPRPA